MLSDFECCLSIHSSQDHQVSQNSPMKKSCGYLSLKYIEDGGKRTGYQLNRRMRLTVAKHTAHMSTWDHNVVLWEGGSYVVSIYIYKMLTRESR